MAPLSLWTKKHAASNCGLVLVFVRQQMLEGIGMLCNVKHAAPHFGGVASVSGVDIGHDEVGSVPELLNGQRAVADIGIEQQSPFVMIGGCLAADTEDANYVLMGFGIGGQFDMDRL